MTIWIADILYKFGRIDKIQAAFTPDALVFGNAIHLVLAEINRQKMTGVELSIKEIQESFEKALDEAGQGQNRYPIRPKGKISAFSFRKARSS